MKNIKLGFGILLVSWVSVCCGSVPILTDISNNQVNIFSRESILKLEHLVTIEICQVLPIAESSPGVKQVCFEKTGTFTGTGSVIHNDPTFSAVLTAAHVCQLELPVDLPPGFTMKVKSSAMTGIDINGNKIPLKYVVAEKKLDQCIVISTKPTNLKALKFSPTAPKPGERAYTLGYPLGAYSPGVVWIGEGFYLGDWSSEKAAYDLLAVGGSSGSPILNTRGEVIGLIHSGFSRLNSYTFSPTYEALKSFLVRSLGIR